MHYCTFHRMIYIDLSLQENGQKIFKYLSRISDVLSPNQIKTWKSTPTHFYMVSLQARFSLVSGVKLSIVTQSAISWLNALTHRKKKDLLIHTLNGYSMFSEHPTHHVFCNIYLYFSHSKSDETIIRTIPKCQVSKWSESSNVFFLLW